MDSKVVYVLVTVFVAGITGTALEKSYLLGKLVYPSSMIQLQMHVFVLQVGMAL